MKPAAPHPQPSAVAPINFPNALRVNIAWIPERLLPEAETLERFAFRWNRKPLQRSRAARAVSQDAVVALLGNIGAEPFDRGLRAALAVRYSQRFERDFDGAERAQDHRRIDVPHMRDAKRLARELAEADAEHDTAFLVAVVDQPARIGPAVHDDGRYGIRALLGFRDVESQRLALGPFRNGAADRLRQQAMPQEDVVEPLLQQHGQRLPQREHEVLG